MAFIIKNVTARIHTSLALPDAITGISKAAEAVITVDNNYAPGDYVVVKGVNGMLDINDYPVRVKSPTATQFVAEGLDTTDFDDYTSGGTCEKVDAWVSFDDITGLNFSDTPAAKTDVTTIHSKIKQEINGLKDSPKATFDMNSSPLDPAVVELRKASDNDTARVFEFVFKDEGITAFVYSEVSGGNGLSGNSGAVATSQVELTLKKLQQYVAT